MRNFDGKDPVTWILHMEQYFDLHNVKSTQKVRIATLYLKPNQFVWYWWHFSHKKIVIWCWASNLHFFTHPLSLFFLFISFFCHSFPSSNCSSHCIIGLFTWFANYANDCCWFRFLVQNAAFPQLTQGFRSWS